MIIFRVPLLPPSVNSVWRKRAGGSFYLTKEAEAYIRAVGLIAPRTLVPAGKMIDVRVCYYLQKKDFLRRDTDNFNKIALDSLTKAGLIVDDRYIKRVDAEKFSVESREDEATVFQLTELLPL